MSAEASASERKETLERIAQAKDTLGKDVIILAHFYQEDDIVECADIVGDSLQLARQAAKQKDVPSIVFCGVSFMAEMARIICSPGQEVLHPEPDARCPLADMAGIEQAEAAWADLKESDKKIIPVAYVNSNADLKALCGRNDGTVCTSANAQRVFEYAFSKGDSVFFFPDGNLGRNTAHALGIADHEIFLWDPAAGIKNTSKDRVKKAKVFLWKGYCYVHTKFLPSDVLKVRKEIQDIQVIVHPECTTEVVALSDFTGSTSMIKHTVETSDPGSRWAIGTEWNFVQRIKVHNPDKFIVPLKRSVCSDMTKIKPRHLLQVLEGLKAGKLHGRVTVAEEITEDARTALQRMLEIA
jgi:quinolinate synthase